MIVLLQIYASYTLNCFYYYLMYDIYPVENSLIIVEKAS